MTDTPRDGDSSALPVRGVHPKDDELARKIREASHPLPVPVPPAQRERGVA